MHILILGTSNSILKNGWSYGLKDALVGHDVTNLSVGASPGVQFATEMNRDFSQYDYVFFDSIPNDEEYVKKAKGYGFSDLNERVIYEIFSTIASQTNLIILGFCNKWSFYEESNIYSSRKKMASKLGCQFIDIRAILSIFLIEDNSIELYESHIAHPKREIAYKIGNAIGEELKTAFFKTKTKAKNFSPNFELVDVTKNSLKVHEYSNALLSMSVSHMRSGEVLDLDESMRCLGVYINAYGTHCSLIKTSADDIKSGMSMTYQRRPSENKFLKIFVPFYNAPRLKNIEVVTAKEDVVLDYYPVMLRKLEAMQGCLEISSVVYWKNINFSNFSVEDVCTSEFKSLSQAVAHKLLEETEPCHKLIHPSVSLITHHKTFMVYSERLKKAYHTKNIGEKDCWLIGLISSGGRLKTAIMMGGIFKEVNVFDRDVEIVAAENKIVFKSNGMYLCAERSGSLTFSRKTARAWEEFSVSG